MTQPAFENPLYQRGLKQGAMYVLELAHTYGLSEFQKKAQDFIDAAEDTEMRLSVELQKTSTSNPPSALL